jgi:thiosulfate dehydrogenase [quinone] large subunit
MSTTDADAHARSLGTDVSLDLSGEWPAYWMALLRVLTGYWFLHAGVTKLMEWPFSAEGYLLYASEGTVLAPVEVWFAQNALWLPNVMVPVGETLVGLGLVVGLLTRLAAVNGAFLMAFFYVTNHGWSHGMVNGDLMGLLLFATVAVFGAGRAFGLDAYVERSRFVQRHEWLRYLLG